jgi:hypothetical protein
MYCWKDLIMASNTSINANRGESSSSVPNDLPENEHDSARLQPEETIIDLPDVSDIPGQEHVHVAPLGALADTTISSDDEEGKGLFDDEEDMDADLESRGTEGNVGKNERQALDDDDYMPTTDEDNLRRASLDSTDFEGEPLNEGSFGEQWSGKDLDVPGSGGDNRNEDIGEEDEENNEYSFDDEDADEQGI